MRVVKKKSNKMSAAKREELLIENFVGLQRVMINLSVKFENLSDNISKLLNVFELSAKDIVANRGRQSQEVDRELINRINMLLDQNKNLINSVRNLENKQREAAFPVMPPMAQSQPSNVPQGMQQSQTIQQNQTKKTIVQTI